MQFTMRTKIEITIVLQTANRHIVSATNGIMPRNNTRRNALASIEIVTKDGVSVFKLGDIPYEGQINVVSSGALLIHLDGEPPQKWKVFRPDEYISFKAYAE